MDILRSTDIVFAGFRWALYAPPTSILDLFLDLGIVTSILGFRWALYAPPTSILDLFLDLGGHCTPTSYSSGI